LYNNYSFRSEIVLEQFFLLDPSFNLNTIKVANNPSGSYAKPLYMYNRDKTVLYYSSTQQKDFIDNLNISQFTFTPSACGHPLAFARATLVRGPRVRWKGGKGKHLNKGTYYLGKYLFYRFPPWPLAILLPLQEQPLSEDRGSAGRGAKAEITAKIKNISILELALQLENDRKNFNKNKPLNSLSKSVLLIDGNNTPWPLAFLLPLQEQPLSEDRGGASPFLRVP
jgi:hypothetical protein